MLNLNEKYKNLPTIMDYSTQKKIMKELIDAGSAELIRNPDGLEFILDNLMISHMDNGVFEFEKSDEIIFTKFTLLLSELKDMKINSDSSQIETIIDVFKNPSFYMP